VAITRVHATTLKTGIQPSPEFEKKGLASYAVNVGTKCGHDCTYCSTGAVLRMRPSFKAAGEKAFDPGYAIVDPGTPDRVLSARGRAYVPIWKPAQKMMLVKSRLFIVTVLGVSGRWPMPSLALRSSTAT